MLPNQHKILHHCERPHIRDPGPDFSLARCVSLHTCGRGLKADDERLSGEPLRLVVPIALSFIVIVLFDLQQAAPVGEDERDDINVILRANLGSHL